MKSKLKFAVVILLIGMIIATMFSGSTLALAEPINDTFDGNYYPMDDALTAKGPKKYRYKYTIPTQVIQLETKYRYRSSSSGDVDYEYLTPIGLYIGDIAIPIGDVSNSLKMQESGKGYEMYTPTNGYSALTVVKSEREVYENSSGSIRRYATTYRIPEITFYSDTLQSGAFLTRHVKDDDDSSGVSYSYQFTPMSYDNPSTLSYSVVDLGASICIDNNLIEGSENEAYPKTIDFDDVKTLSWSDELSQKVTVKKDGVLVGQYIGAEQSELIIKESGVYDITCENNGSKFYYKFIVKLKEKPPIESGGDGSIHVFGSLNIGGSTVEIPTNANIGGNTATYNGLDKITFENSSTDPKYNITWIETTDKTGTKYLIADRNLLINISWQDLQKQNLIHGTEVYIDGLKYTLMIPSNSMWDELVSKVGSEEMWNYNLPSVMSDIITEGDGGSKTSIRGGNVLEDSGLIDQFTANSSFGFRPVLVAKMIGGGSGDETDPEEARGIIEEAILGSIEKLFLLISVQLCGLIDLTIGLFKQLVGLENVNINGEANLIMFFLEDNSIRNTLIITMLIGVAMLFAFTVVQFVRSTNASDLGSENSKMHPKYIFESFIKSLFNIIVIPMAVIMLISCSNIVMGQLNKAMEVGVIGNSEESISYGGQMLLIMATTNEDKARLLDFEGIDENNFHESYESTGGDEKYFPNGQITNLVPKGENCILYAQDSIYPSLTYMDLDNWLSEEGCYYIPTQRLNIFVGFVGSVSLLVVLVLCSFMFVKRLFDIVLLYLVSPFLIATMPIDDGKRFSAWRDMMLSKVLSAYAIIITINLYLMIIPKLTINPGITFFSGSQNSIANATVQLLFVIGGAFALNGSNLLFSQLIGSGTQEFQQGTMSSMAMQSMVRAGAGIAVGGIGVAKALGGGAIRHGVGTAFGGAGYAKNAFMQTGMGKGVGNWASSIKNRPEKSPADYEKMTPKQQDKHDGKKAKQEQQRVVQDNKQIRTEMGMSTSSNKGINVARTMGRIGADVMRNGISSVPSSIKNNYAQLGREEYVRKKIPDYKSPTDTSTKK